LILAGTAVLIGLVPFAVLRCCTPQLPEPDVVPLSADFTAPVDLEGTSTAVTPSLTFNDDTDTGLFRSTTDTLNVTTAGTERLEIDASALSIVPPLEAQSTAEITGDTTLNALLILTDQSVSILADATTITPTTSYVTLNPSGTHTIDFADGSVAGQVLFLYNDSDTGDTCTIDESEFNADIGGDLSLAHDNAVSLLWDGSQWIQFTIQTNN
jgi:hypothetical protein